MKVKIVVMLKPEVLDTQGKAVEGALKRSGYESIEKVRVGKNIELDVMEGDQDKAEKLIQEICKKILSNPIIEDVHYEFA